MSHDHGHDWDDAQHDEQAWWSTCANTYWEETKQLVYARYMGITFQEDERGPYLINLGNKSVLDIGGGPCSLLLKATMTSTRTVADPCEYPSWVGERYKAQGIEYAQVKGEDIDEFMKSKDEKYSEVWLYNCLQHVDDPAKIISNALSALKPGGTFRIFEWVNTATNTAHPHSLSKADLDGWIGQSGNVVTLAEQGCYGDAYHGAFQIN